MSTKWSKTPAHKEDAWGKGNFGYKVFKQKLTLTASATNFLKKKGS